MANTLLRSVSGLRQFVWKRTVSRFFVADSKHMFTVAFTVNVAIASVSVLTIVRENM